MRRSHPSRQHRARWGPRLGPNTMCGGGTPTDHVAGCAEYYFEPDFDHAITRGTPNPLETTLDFTGIDFLTEDRHNTPVISRLRMRTSTATDVEWDLDYDAKEGKITSSNLFAAYQHGFYRFQFRRFVCERAAGDDAAQHDAVVAVVAERAESVQPDSHGGGLWSGEQTGSELRAECGLRSDSPAAAVRSGSGAVQPELLRDHLPVPALLPGIDPRRLGIYGQHQLRRIYQCRRSSAPDQLVLTAGHRAKKAFLLIATKRGSDRLARGPNCDNKRATRLATVFRAKKVVFLLRKGFLTGCVLAIAAPFGAAQQTPANTQAPASTVPANTRAPVGNPIPAAMAAAPPDPAAAVVPALERKIEVMIRAELAVPPQYEIAIGPRQKSDVNGYDTIAVTFLLPSQPDRSRR